jgi:hypothetical protein
VLAILADLVLRWRADDEKDLPRLVGGVLGFGLLPVTGLAVVALPALDAHTRLLLGRSLAYQVTEKVPRAQEFAARRAAESPSPATL